MVKKRAKKKLHKKQLQAKIVKYEQTTLRLINELDSNKPMDSQLQEIRKILEPHVEEVVATMKQQEATKEVKVLPATPTAPTSVNEKPKADTPVAITKFEAMLEVDEPKAVVEEAKGEEKVAPLRLDVATTLYTYLCNQAEAKDCSYETVLIEKLQEFQAGSQELESNDFSGCDTNQRIFVHLTDDLRAMVEGFAKQHKLPKRAVVETICSTLIRKG